MYPGIDKEFLESIEKGLKMESKNVVIEWNSLGGFEVVCAEQCPRYNKTAQCGCSERCADWCTARDRAFEEMEQIADHVMYPNE